MREESNRKRMGTIQLNKGHITMKKIKMIASATAVTLFSASEIFAQVAPPGGGGGGGVPELNPLAIGSALVLVVGGTLVMTGRKKK